MRVPVRIQYSYKNYPLSNELTKKNARVGLLTRPIFGIFLGVIPGVLGMMFFPSSVAVPMILLFAGIVAGPILLLAYRKKKFAQYDAEYARLLQSMQQPVQGQTNFASRSL